MDRVRLFIAVPVSEEIENTVGAVEEDLKRSRADVKWVPPGNVHVTLKFLGDVETDRVDEISAALEQALEGVRGFEALVSGVGSFPPNPRRARVVFLGLAEGVEEMKELARRVEDSMASLGFEKEKRAFKSHLTIGRVRRGSRRLDELGQGIADHEFKPLKLAVYRVNLVESKLTPSGAVYTVLATFGLER